MKNQLLYILLLSALTIYCRDCFSQSNIPLSYETECLGVELDGSQTVRSWGIGKSKIDAKEQAKKNAVWDVIFKGIPSNGTGCNTRPLLYEVNAQEKYEYYFNAFFKDGGEYKKYINNADTKKGSKITKKGKSQDAVSVVVRVKRMELLERLIADKIIKQ
nr:hypothetical protein [Prevotella sp.]